MYVGVDRVDETRCVAGKADEVTQITTPVDTPGVPVPSAFLYRTRTKDDEWTDEGVSDYYT